MLLTPSEVYVLALLSTQKAQLKWNIPDPKAFARTLVGLAFQESCLNKGAEDLRCMDTDARPYNAKTKKYLSSALGLTQVLDGTQRAIERLMGADKPLSGWSYKPGDARRNPLYAMDLAAAYMGYFVNGGAKTPKGSIPAALVAYHDGHYSKNGAGQSYARAIAKHIESFDWAVIDEVANGATQGLAKALLLYMFSGEWR